MANERHDIHFVWHAAFLREQRGKWCGRLRTAPLEERRDTEKQSFESGRAAIPGEKIEMRRKAQMRGSYEFTEQFYKSN